MVAPRLAEPDLRRLHGPRVELGPGAVRRLPLAVNRVGRNRAFVVTDPGVRAAGIVAAVEHALAAQGVETVVCDRVSANPSTTAIDEAAEYARDFGEAAVVAVGGGSSMDVAKCVALLAVNPGGAADCDLGLTRAATGQPVVAVPTTAGTGAETNGFAVVADPLTKGKVYLGHACVRPRWAVLDPELSVDLPPLATAATGMDAVVHCVESLASRGATPRSTTYAVQALALVSRYLPRAVDHGTDLEARSRLLLGAHLAGRALSISGLGLIHGTAHAVTGHTGAPHGLALCAVLGEVMARSVGAAERPYARVAATLGVAGPGSDVATRAAATVDAVPRLAKRVGAYRRLRDLGVTPQMLGGISATAVNDPVSRNHPRAVSAAEVEDLLRAAW